MREKLIKSKSIYKGRIVELLIDEVKLSNGKPAKREVVKHPGAVTIIPVISKDKLILVEQYRHPIKKITLEFPAGTLNKGEEPLTCAKRELIEETGYRAEKINKLITYYSAPGFCSEIMHMFLAPKVKKVSAQNTDEDEFLNVKIVTLKTAIKMLADNKIIDSKTVIGLLLLSSFKTVLET